MVFKHKSFDSIKKKEENEENCQVLDPCHLDKLPESWSVPYNQVKVLFEFDEPCFNESVTNIIAREKYGPSPTLSLNPVYHLVVRLHD